MGQSAARLSKRIVNLLADNPGGASLWAPVIGAVNNMMGSSSQSNELRGLQQYGKIFRYLLAAPFFPQVGKPAGAQKLGSHLLFQAGQ